ncbi:MAG: SDR family oxidoreductase [Euryarchaeota archaeon]|nr:SDR family oxidoreductase [Euryarchaeota archaeon]
MSEEKVAVVTGAGRGIGAAVALMLAERGVRVVLVSRNEEELRRVAGEVSRRGGRAEVVCADVARESDVRRIFSTAEEAGGVDILVNNAGTAIRKRLIETTAGEFDRVMATNVRGVFLCCREALRRGMLERGGVIVNVSSGAGKVGFPELSAYCASKFAVLGLTQALALEVAPKVRVHAVCPGGTDTRMYRSLFPEDDFSKLLSPEDVARVIVELCMNPGNYGDCVEIY